MNFQAMRTFVFALTCLTIVATAELAVVLSTVSPSNATGQELWLFFVCLWLAASGWLTWVWHSIKQRLIYRFHAVSLPVSLRQAALCSGLVTLGLFFNSLHILTVWDMLPLGVSGVLIEFFFQADTTPLSRRHGSLARS